MFVFKYNFFYITYFYIHASWNDCMLCKKITTNALLHKQGDKKCIL